MLRWIRRLGALTVLLLAACAAQERRAPTVVIVAPPEGAAFEAGEAIPIAVSAASSAGVARVELWLDGALVASEQRSEPPIAFTARFAYRPTREGALLFQAFAVDAQGRRSAPAVLRVRYGAAATPTPNLAVVTTVVVGERGCRQAALFVQDVTVPDGTPIRAGTVFTKTWRMRNVSTCDWGLGYMLVHESDTPLGLVSRVNVPPTPSNGVVDISVPMRAPDQPGVYTSTWRLQDPQGQWFGNRVFVVIRVP